MARATRSCSRVLERPIVVSGIGRGENVSLTLAPTLLVGMIFLLRFGPDGWPLRWRVRWAENPARPSR